MITFLPHVSFELSARVLDDRRLGKQRVENMMIMEILAGTASVSAMRWSSHPAVDMWFNHRHSLMSYQSKICAEWRSRGFQDNVCFERTKRAFQSKPGSLFTPPWLGDDRLHGSHRAALLYKNPDWYSQFGWDEQPALRYWWPTKKGNS